MIEHQVHSNAFACLWEYGQSDCGFSHLEKAKLWSSFLLAGNLVGRCKNSLGRRTGGQLRRSLALYQLITKRPIIFLLLLHQCYSDFLHFYTLFILPSFRSLQGPFYHSLQLLSSQHSPSAYSYPFGAGSGPVLTGLIDHRCSHPPLPRKDGSDRLQNIFIEVAMWVFRCGQVY
jgi:hypothetical protein